jgi:hypothetical protein
MGSRGPSYSKRGGFATILNKCLRGSPLLKCPRDYCQEPLVENETDFNHTEYCPGCGYYKEEKYEVPRKSYKRKDVVYNKRDKKKKESKSKETTV